MMAAAQAAAEAAVAAARESTNGGVSSASAEPETMMGVSFEQNTNELVGAIHQQTDLGDQAALIQGLMDCQDPSLPEANMNSLLQMIAEQEREKQAAAAAEAARNQRPDKHYFTVAQNGMILEATKTVTGVPPDALLMTSAYDSVYEDDLKGFHAIKAHFWDTDHPEVPVFVRRRTLEGGWVWVAAEVVSYLQEPIAGYILQETRVDDQQLAFEMNRVTRIIAILVEAIEAANNTAATQTGRQGDPRYEQQSNHASEIPGVKDDAAKFQAMIMEQASAESGGSAATAQENTLQNIMRAAATTGGAIQTGNVNINNGSNPVASLEQEMMRNRETYNPFSVMEMVKEGARLDLGMTELSQTEVETVFLVLSGALTLEDLHEVFTVSLQSRQSLSTVLQFLNASLFRHKHHPQASRKNGVSFLPGGLNLQPPPISVINLSYTYIGNTGVELLSELMYMDGSSLKTLDLSFCGISDRGFLAFAKALSKRKRKAKEPLRGLILSGNYLGKRAAYELGSGISMEGGKRMVRNSSASFNTGYDEDSESEFDDDEADEDLFNAASASKRSRRVPQPRTPAECCTKGVGLQVLHLGSSSMSSEVLKDFLRGLGPHCPIQELNLSSNNLGPTGVSTLVEFLERKRANHIAMRFLNRLDLSNNNLKVQGTTELARAIAKRSKIHLVELRMSANGIGSAGIETIMNRLLQHNLVSLSLDKNSIGDHGCQLVAASLQSMQSLACLNLCFNQIGSRGVNSLMRSLVGCESMTSLGLSGNIIKISGAVALAFTLAQHPRLEELDLDNCCLSQAAQCHIVAGIISNRWVPMNRLNGFEVGPPMVAIGSLPEVYAHNLSNEACFRFRKDEQMKTILQWMDRNRVARSCGSDGLGGRLNGDSEFLTPEYVSSVNEVHGTPSQNAYLRLLGWLSRIPFDEEELTSLRKYFYESDGGEGDRGSDGYINLKLRGDLLAALDSDVADEIRDNAPTSEHGCGGSIGIDLDVLGAPQEHDSWEYMKGSLLDDGPSKGGVVVQPIETEDNGSDEIPREATNKRKPSHLEIRHSGSGDAQFSSLRSMRSSMSTLSRQSLPRSESERSGGSQTSRKRRGVGLKARITMFPQFEAKLEELKTTAAEMINDEIDAEQQEVILTQYAEASLTILRQLRYHCMNSGLDGWRQGGLKRKVLVVDDSLVTRKLVSRAFEKADFIVDTATNGEEGVEKLQKSIYDIAFMDIDMPVMNGFEATKALRQWEDTFRPGARQPICALTAAIVDDFERSELMKFKEAGLDVMESKPCNIPRLFKVVDDVSPMFSDLKISGIRNRNGSAAGMEPEDALWTT